MGILRLMFIYLPAAFLGMFAAPFILKFDQKFKIWNYASLASLLIPIFIVTLINETTHGHSMSDSAFGFEVFLSIISLLSLVSFAILRIAWRKSQGMDPQIARSCSYFFFFLFSPYIFGWEAGKPILEWLEDVLGVRLLHTPEQGQYRPLTQDEAAANEEMRREGLYKAIHGKHSWEIEKKDE